mgnify:CR=1 FL=1
MFPKVKKEKDENKSKVKLKFLKTSVGIEVDEEICQGCGICVKVCPTQALGRGPVGGSKKHVMENIIPTVVDPNTCSYCGLCAYMCPWNAITVEKNDEEIKIEDLQIVAKKAVPELDYEMAKCKEGVNDAKAYLEGDIEITTNNCPGGCNTCIEVCPTEALTMVKPDTPWDKGREIKVDKDKCILCGTCTNACPVFDAIKLKIENVKHKGDYNKIFWDKIVEQIKISRMRDGKKIN